MKRKQRHGPIPQYVTKKLIARQERDEFAFLTVPERDRVYDSSLSKPGRICKRCRGFVAGGVAQCPECWAI